MNDKNSKSDDHTRNINRQACDNDDFSSYDIKTAYQDLNSGIEDLQLVAINFFLRALDSDKNKDIIDNYQANSILYLKEISQYGSTDEIQSLALICISLFYKYKGLEVSIINDPFYIQFLIKEKLMSSIPEADAVLHILSVIADEEEDSIGIILELSFFDLVPELPPETEYGELIDIIVKQKANELPDIDKVVSLLPIMLDSQNPNNVCHALKCIEIFVTMDWDCFDFDGFHSGFPQFLLSDDEQIVATAFSLLEKITPSEDDMNAVFQCLSNGGDVSLKAMKYLIKNQELWAENIPSDLYYCLISCVSSLKYNDVGMALALLIDSLSAPGIEFNPDQIEILSNFLNDRNSATYVIKAFCIIWDKIQANDDNSWFIEILQKHDTELEEMASCADEDVSEVASKLLEILP